MQLSPTTSYYIRKLLRQNFDRLKCVIAPGAGLQADPFGDVGAVINSLYLDEAELLMVIKNLETLVVYHQALNNQTIQHLEEITKTEKTIFWLLGFKFKPIEEQIRFSPTLLSA